MNRIYAVLLLRLLEVVTRNDDDQELLDLYNSWKPELERWARKGAH